MNDEKVPTIEDVRQQIDGLDRRIVELIAERQKWVLTAGVLKKDEQDVLLPTASAAAQAVQRDAAVTGFR